MQLDVVQISFQGVVGATDCDVPHEDLRILGFYVMRTFIPLYREAMQSVLTCSWVDFLCL